MKRLCLGVLLAAAVAPPADAATRTGFAFGRTGGSIMPFGLEISTTGKVTATGAAPSHRTRLTKQDLADLNRVAFVTQFNTLPAVTACPHTLPDIAARWIRVGGRTVRVHGACLARFNRLWAALGKTTER